MSAAATPKCRGAASTLGTLPQELWTLCLPFLTPVEFMRWSCTSATMHVALLSAMTGAPAATQLAKAMMAVVLRKHVEWGEAQRHWDWNYMTFHGRKKPQRHMARDNQDQLTPYGTYIEMKYMEYYVLSQAIVNRATGTAHPDIVLWTHAQVMSLHDRLQLVHHIREDAGVQLIPCYLNQRNCNSLKELDDADMNIGQVQAIMEVQWVPRPNGHPERELYETELHALVNAQARPRDGTLHSPAFARGGRHRLV